MGWTGVPSGAGSAPILDMEDAIWYDTVDVNLNGVYLVTKWVGCATKFGVIGFTQQLATELAQQGIRVNCVAPGSYATDMMDGTIGRTARTAGPSRGTCG